MECVNLKERFGRRFKVRREESHEFERSQFRAAEEPWLQIIPCIGGEIYPHGGNRLAAFLRSGPRAERLKRLPCVQVKTVGNDGVTVTFDVADFDQIVEIMQPRRRAQRNLTPEQRQAIGERLRVAREGRQTIVGSHPRGQESTIGA